MRSWETQRTSIRSTQCASLPAHQGLSASEYDKGITRGTYGLKADLPIKAHDFVILAVSQLLIPTDSTAHVGNLVNPDASHLTGAMEWDSGDGKNDEELVLELLRRLRDESTFVVAWRRCSSPSPVEAC